MTGSGPRRTRATHAQKLKQIASQKLRRATSEDLETLSAVVRDQAGEEGECEDGSSPRKPTELDEPWLYHFRSGDEVWIRTAGERWHHGLVIGQTTRKGETRQKEGLYYPVQFSRIRKYFAPLNGEIKPDTEHIRDLLRAAGWFFEDSDSDE